MVNELLGACEGLVNIDAYLRSLRGNWDSESMKCRG